MQLISVVSPFFNEEDGIEEFLEELLKILTSATNYKFEIILVNDGSVDESENVILRFMKRNASKLINIQLVNFTRNFGHQAALLAGLEIANGAAVISLDSDLQDPPELIPQMIKEWEQGNHVVLMRRVNRGKEKMLKRTLSLFYYQLLKMASGQNSTSNVGDFRLISRQALINLLNAQGSSVFLRGAISWMGYDAKIIEYNRGNRFSGTTKYSMSKMVNLGIQGIINSGNRLLRLPFFLSFFSFGISGAVSAIMIYNKIYHPDRTIPGFTSITLLILWGITLNMFSIGVLGEYIFNTLRSSSRIPNYIIKSKFTNVSNKYRNN